MKKSFLILGLWAFICVTGYQAQTAVNVTADAQLIVNSNYAELIIMRILPFRTVDQRNKTNDEVRILGGNPIVDQTYMLGSPISQPYLDLCYILLYNDKVTILSKYINAFFELQDEIIITFILTLVDNMTEFKKAYNALPDVEGFDKGCSNQNKPFQDMLKVWTESDRPPDGQVESTEMDKEIGLLNDEKPKWNDTRVELDKVLMKSSYGMAKDVLINYATRNKHPIEDDIKATIKDPDLADAYSSLGVEIINLVSRYFKIQSSLIKSLFITYFIFAFFLKIERLTKHTPFEIISYRMYFNNSIFFCEAMYIQDKYTYFATKLRANSDGDHEWIVWNVLIGILKPDDWKQVDEIFKKNNNNIGLVEFISHNIFGDFVLMETFAYLIDSTYKPKFLSVPPPIQTSGTPLPYGNGGAQSKMAVPTSDDPDGYYAEDVPALTGQPAIAGQTAPIPAGQTVPVPAGQIAPVPAGQIAPVPVGQIAPVPVGQTAPIPVGQTAPIPVGQTAPVPVDQTALVPVSETAPVPVGQTAPVTAGQTAPVPTGQTAPVPVSETAPVPTGQTAPVPADQTALVPVSETAPVPAGQTAPVPVGQTAPVTAGQAAPVATSQTAPVPASQIAPLPAAQPVPPGSGSALPPVPATVVSPTPPSS